LEHLATTQCRNQKKIINFSTTTNGNPKTSIKWPSPMVTGTTDTLLEKKYVWHADSQQEHYVNLMEFRQILPVWMKMKWLTVNALSAKYKSKSANVFCGKTSVEN